MLAQTQDAATVYAEFARQSSILQAAQPASDAYETARQTMLRLYPQLYYHAAAFSQQRKMSNALTFAKAYVDMAMMPQFESMHLEKSESYPTMTYFVASNYYNQKNYSDAAVYLQRYLDLREPKNRAMVFLFLAKSYENLHDYDRQIATLESGLYEFPDNSDLLAMSINCRMGKGYYQDALPYVDRALQYKPGDAKLMSIKGQCLEALQQYEEAVTIYTLLAERQKTLPIYKHYAVNLFNCAVQFYPVDRTTATAYFQRAIPVLKQVVANDPTSVPFTNALAMAYLYTDQYELLEETNDRLRTMGAAEVSAGSAAAPPTLASDMPRPSQAAPARTQSGYTVPTPSGYASATPATAQQTPAPAQQKGFVAFAQTYIEKEITQWQEKDPFETIEEYKMRVTEQTRQQKVEELLAEAKKKYIAQHAKKVKINDFQLEPYDAENGVFLIRSVYGDIILPVPRENDEARNFANTWKSVTLENAQFDIAGDDMVIRSMDFVTHNGNVYRYSDKDERRYSQTEIAMQFDNIDYSRLGGGSAKKNDVRIEKNSLTVGNSDVDINIPESKNVHSDRFAFIIGNEHYQQVASVPYAVHDAQIMGKYCNKMLGVPETNIRLYEDATFGTMLGCIRDVKTITQAFNGQVDIIFYYAGHGIPDEANKSAYLLPVDADGTQTETCYAVSRLYRELGQLGARSVIVLMDACFSGSLRGEGMLASARGVALKAKPDEPQGKMVAVSAATGDETAFPYEEQQHGMFTYYLLKGMRESRGKLTWGDLVNYVQTQVRQRSVVINHKSQTPTVSTSADAGNWQSWVVK